MALSFCGQGAQAPGMGRSWVGEKSWSLVDRASAAAGRDVAHLLLDAGAEELRMTRNAQLAILAFSLVVDDALRRAGLRPAACLGHSVGEYAALISAGALGFEDGVRLVAARGEAMQAADEVHPGTMLAITGLDDDDAQAACCRADGDVWVANYNGPGHVVVAGSHAAVSAAEEAALELGASATARLPVGGAYHTRFMAPARDRLRDALARTEFSAPDVPVIANVDARPHEAAGQWRALLSAQLCSPVRWSQSVRRLAALDAGPVVQVGPRPSLAKLIEHSAPGRRVVAGCEPADVDAAAAAGRGQAGRPAGDHVLVSPATGVYQNVPSAGAVTTDGEILAEGDVVGLVGGEPVRSPFAAWLMRVLAREGQHVRKGDPIAALRVL